MYLALETSRYNQYINFQITAQWLLYTDNKIDFIMVFDAILTDRQSAQKLRRNPIEDGAISGFSGQKSVPE